MKEGATDIPKAYEPAKTEDSLYASWLERGLFRSAPDSRRAFAIMLPPPNITGSLHMGHALNATLQDVIFRFRRMKGDNALWLPGTDHGGIATQNVVEKLLKIEGKKRQEIGREKFLERMWSWRKATGDAILNQLKRLGSGCDWERTRFTLDETCSRAVAEAFVRFYKKGLIYRGKRIVNFCVRCESALSDIEVEHEEKDGSLWHIRYPLSEGDGHIVVATTRPETMLGDTAVAVHPKDTRYKNLIGKMVRLPLAEREIPIVADSFVDSKFGTGAVKVTPAHDPNDFEIGERHHLPLVVVIDERGKMTEEAGKNYAGMNRMVCRKKVLEDLAAQELLLKTEPYRHAVGCCYRCEEAIEPLISEQWFLKVGEMAKKAKEAVVKGEIKFYPESWVKPYCLWLDNIRDWCISRQIWWGHRIPVWRCVGDEACRMECKEPIVSVEPPDCCPHCGSKNLEQDPDVLDTWFSSALWTFSTLGWPEASKDLKYYHPTGVLVTGYEILYLWVARMAMFSLELLGEVPFREVCIHGIVRDKRGKKMSKSLGNVIDPLTIAERFGTDALRFSLASSAVPGRDMQIADENFASARNFCNKLWNVSRFFLMNLSEAPPRQFDPKELGLPERWILSECARAAESLSKAYETYQLAEAARILYEFLWSNFCDWYVEISKISLLNGSDPRRAQTLFVLETVLKNSLKLAHPILPFITEAIWRTLPGEKANTPLLDIPFPSASEIYIGDEEAFGEMDLLMETVSAIRNIRAEFSFPSGSRPSLFVRGQEIELAKLRSQEAVVRHLGKLQELRLGENLPQPKNSVSAVVGALELFLPLEGMIDLAKEKGRLEREMGKLAGELSRLSAKLSNDGFRTGAPSEEVERVKRLEEDAREKQKRLAKIQESLG